MMYACINDMVGTAVYEEIDLENNAFVRKMVLKSYLCYIGAFEDFFIL